MTAALPLLLKFGLPALAGLGGLFSNRGSQTKQNTITDQTQKTDNTTMPVYDPKNQLFRDNLINAYMSNLEGNDDYFDAYTRSGLSDINKSYESSNNQIQNILASRGITGPMAGSGLSAPILQRQSNMSSFLNTIPQLQDQRKQSILQSAGSFMSSLPVGSHQMGTTTSHGTNNSTMTQPSNMLGGLFGNLATTLGGMYGNGVFSDNDPWTTKGTQRV